MVYVYLATGFEEVEAITIIDLLRRGAIDTKSISITGEKLVTGANDITIEADLLFEEADHDSCEMIVLPGGMPGASNLGACTELTDQIKIFAESGKKVAAICAAPMVLAKCGILKNKDATIYPGMEDQLLDAKPTGDSITISSNIITGKGPGFAMEFALALVCILRGAEAQNQVAEGLLFK